jgi:hypothetical protein
MSHWNIRPARGARAAVVTTGLLLLAALAAPHAEAQADQTTWKLFGYIHGTAQQIADQINSQVIEQARRRDELRTRVTELRAEREATEQKLIQTTRESAQYKALKDDAEKAKTALTSARASEDTASALASGSRYNHDAGEMAELERKAIASSPLLKSIRETLLAKEDLLTRAEVSLQQAVDWRLKMIDAMRGSFCMPGPLKIGSKGILGWVLVEHVLSSDSMMVTYKEQSEADGERRPSDAGDGIVTVKVWVREVHLLVRGINTKAMIDGKKARLDTAFELTDERAGIGREPDTVYVVEPKDDPLNTLFVAIESMKDPPTTQPAEDGTSVEPPTIYSDAKPLRPPNFDN